MPTLHGIPHLRAVRALEKAGFRIVREGKHTVMTDGSHFVTIPRHNSTHAVTMGGIVGDAGLTVDRFKKLLWSTPGEGFSRDGHDDFIPATFPRHDRNPAY